MTSFSPLEILHTTSKKVTCSGSRDNKNQDSGHPLIYLNMGENNFVICPYCSKYFTTEKSISFTSKNIKK